MLRHDLGHVAIGVLDAHRGDLAAVEAVDVGRRLAHDLLLLLELGAVVVADDVNRVGGLGVARKVVQHDEALVAVGVLGLGGGRHEAVELAGDVDGVDHAVLRGSGVNREAREVHVGLGGVEALVVHDADGAAVERVAEGRTVLLEVEQLGAVAELLVGHERNCEARVRDGRVGLNAGDERHDLGDAGLVVGGEQGAAVGADDPAAHHVVQLGVDGGVGEDLLAVDHAHDELAALVVDDLRLHAVARHARLGIDVRVERERRQVLRPRRCGNMSRHVGMLGRLDVLGAQLAQLGGEQLGHVELALCRRDLIGVLGVALRVGAHVAQKALDDVGVASGLRIGAAHGSLPSESGIVDRKNSSAMACRMARLGIECHKTASVHTFFFVVYDFAILIKRCCDSSPETEQA